MTAGHGGSPGPVVCVAEDRRSCEPGLRILIASLAKTNPLVGICLFVPDPRPEFVRWLATFPRVRVNPQGGIADDWLGYNVKPAAIRAVLRQGHRDVLWIDSDVVVLRSLAPCLAGIDAETVVATEEALCVNHDDPDALRARLWGLPVGRVLPFTLNTGVLRLTAAHLPLIERWLELLASDAYRSGQARGWQERAPHLLGDQEVFTALMASAEFARLPLRPLYRGRHIIQYFGLSGYTLGERLRHLLRPPVFVHSQGSKPWWRPRPAAGARGRLLDLYQQLSPYTLAARRHARALDDRSWLRPRSRLGAILALAGANRMPLVGLPIAAFADAARLARRVLPRARRDR